AATIDAVLINLSSYGYIPTEWVSVLFLVLFGITTALHFGQALFFRLWFLLPTAVLCGALEVAGWSGRLWSSINHVNCSNPAASTLAIANNSPYLLQIVTTIIAPTPLLGANFIILGRIIHLLGSRYSRLSSRLYSRIFLTCDIIALIVQGLGGGIAASANNGDQKQANLGGNIMLGGIIFQLVAIILYSSLATEFFLRYVKDRPLRHDSVAYQKRTKTTGRTKLLLLGMVLMTIFLFIRSIYRTVELAGGWNGSIITTQWLFDIFDGLMIILAMLTLNLLHPGILLLPEEARASPSSSSSEVGLHSSSERSVGPVKTY
ncbi:RTA1 like protein-domain-containing protein, partial [Vararia minispora EC-137]